MSVIIQLGELSFFPNPSANLVGAKKEGGVLLKKIKVGIWGFGKTGKLIADEFLKDSRFVLSWVVRKNKIKHSKFASSDLGYETNIGKIIPISDVSDNFFLKNPVDILVDFSHNYGVHSYKNAAKSGIAIISGVSNYQPEELSLLKSLSEITPVLYSPNITLGVTFLMVASHVLKKIIPNADIEIIEEHFKGKTEVSGTAKKIAQTLELDESQHINSIRVGGIVGRHEVIFGMPNQTIRLSHSSISRAAFGQGAIFAAKHLIGKMPGLYSMESIIADMVRKHCPTY